MSSFTKLSIIKGTEKIYIKGLKGKKVIRKNIHLSE